MEAVCVVWCSLVIACRYDPLPILREAIHLIAPGSPITIYFEFVEPLVECYLFLQKNELAVKMQLFDAWMREFQTLAGRAHPHMTMPTSGGYLLVAVFVGGSAASDGSMPGVSHKRQRT
jgi:tRNA A58 N-methylase Trm61